MTKEQIKAAFGTASMSESRINEMEKQLLNKIKADSICTDSDVEHGKSYSPQPDRSSRKSVFAIAAAAAAVTIFTIAGSHFFGKSPISGQSGSVDTAESVVTSDSSAVPATTEPVTAVQTEEVIQPVQGYYDDIYEGLNMNTYVGPPATYEERMSIITDPRSGGLDSLYLVETVKALTLAECSQLAGWEEFSSPYDGATTEAESTEADNYYVGSTIYEVRVIRDLISGEKQSRTMYVSLSMENPVRQIHGDPCYSPRERFTLAVLNPTDSTCEILRTVGGFRLDVVQEDGVLMAYSRSNRPTDELHISGSVDISQEVIRSTTDNPAVYTQKLPLDNLAEFLRNDWQQRGVSRHFADTSTAEAVSAYVLNPDLLSELGMTYAQLCEKYGEPHSSVSNTCTFDGGYGIYAWKSYEGVQQSNLSEAGGCNYIDGITPQKLLVGFGSSLSYEEFQQQSGFVLESADTEATLDYRFWSSFSHPVHENLLISLATEQYNVIDDSTSIVVMLDIDCMQAVRDTSETISVNTDLLSELGLNFTQLCEKYGEPVGGRLNSRRFEGGYGLYTWRSYVEGISFDDENIRYAGGCNMIQGIRSDHLFTGPSSPMSLEDFREKTGLWEITANTQKTLMYDAYYLKLTHPLFKDIEIITHTAEYGVLSGDELWTLIIPIHCALIGEVEQAPKPYAGLPLFSLQNYQREYVLVTVEIQHIYRLEEKHFGSVEEGDTADILIPTVLYEDFEESDSVILYFDKNRSLPYIRYTIIPSNEQAKQLSYDNIFSDASFFSRDDILLFKDGIMTELEADDELRSFYYGFDNTTPIGIDYPEFFYGISVSEADRILDEAQRLSEEREAAYREDKRLGAPSEDYLSHDSFLSGTRMRVRLTDSSAVPPAEDVGLEVISSEDEKWLPSPR